MWNVHPVSGTGIRTHDLWIVSLLPQPLDQGSRPTSMCVFVKKRKIEWERACEGRERKRCLSALKLFSVTRWTSQERDWETKLLGRFWANFEKDVLINLTVKWWSKQDDEVIKTSSTTTTSARTYLQSYLPTDVDVVAVVGTPRLPKKSFHFIPSKNVFFESS